MKTGSEHFQGRPADARAAVLITNVNALGLKGAPWPLFIPALPRHRRRQDQRLAGVLLREVRRDAEDVAGRRLFRGYELLERGESDRHRRAASDAGPGFLFASQLGPVDIHRSQIMKAAIAAKLRNDATVLS